MWSTRAKLTIAAEVATILMAAGSAAIWGYGHIESVRPLWAGKVNWLYAALAVSFATNVLFSIGSRQQAKAIPAKVLGGRISGEQAALFRHYSVRASDLADRLEMLSQHWYEAGEVLSRPLDKAMPVKNVLGAHSRERDIFTIVYADHIDWMVREIPEFKDDLPAFGSSVEYLTLLKLLKAHATLLRDAAKETDA